MSEPLETPQIEIGTDSLSVPPQALQTSDSQTTQSGVWRVGTLVYTTGGLVVLFWWLLWGDFAWSLKERSVLPVLQILIRKFGGSDTYYSIIANFFPPAITLLLGPIISYRSDRHRGRWGRRIPYLLIPTPLALLAMIGLAMSPRLGDRLHLSLGPAQTTLILFGLFWTLFEVSSTIILAVFYAFVNDVVPRPVLGRFYGFFRAFSLLAGMVYGHFLFKRAEENYVWIFLGIGLLYLVAFSAMCFAVKEGKYPRPPQDDGKAPGTSSFFSAVQLYFRECFTKPYYFWVFGAIVLPTLAFIPINTFNIYYSQSVGMSPARYGDLTALYFLLSLLQSIPLGWLIDRYNPMRVAIVALLLHGMAAYWGAFLSHSPAQFAIAFVATGTLSGTWFTATAALNAVLLPKLKYAQLASASNTLLALGQMAFGLGLGPLLNHLHHQYSYTYLAAGILDVLGLIATIKVFRMYLKLGGPDRYVAP